MVSEPRHCRGSPVGSIRPVRFEQSPNHRSRGLIPWLDVHRVQYGLRTSIETLLTAAEVIRASLLLGCHPQVSCELTCDGF